MTQEPRARGDGFSIPIPRGFSNITEEVGISAERLQRLREAGRVGIQRFPADPDLDDGYVAILATFMPFGDWPELLTDDNVCVEAARESAANQSGKLFASARLVDVPGGSGCQALLDVPDQTMRLRYVAPDSFVGIQGTRREWQTIVAVGPGRNYLMIQCSFDPGTALGPASCNLVLQGLQVEDPTG